MNGMNNSSKQLGYAAAAILIVGVVAVGFWYFAKGRASKQSLASSQVVTDFHIGLAALDVEENERALRALSEAVKLEQNEPALWADLAIAQLRLNELAAARESLERALKLAPGSRDLALLNAELLAHSGEVERAIEQLREVHKQWPDNIAATYSLVMLLGQIRSSDADTQRLELLSDILLRAPTNLQALTEKARVAAALQDEAALQAALGILQSDQYQWPDKLQEQLDTATRAIGNQDFRQAALAMTFFQNLLKARPEYQQSLAALGNLSAASVGTPIREFLRLAAPPLEAAPADMDIAFQVESQGKAQPRAEQVWAIEHSGTSNPTIAVLTAGQLRMGDAAPLPFPAPAGRAAASSSLCASDLNFDFQQDLVAVGEEGLTAYLGNQDGTFQSQKLALEATEGGWRGVWSVDVDADGDSDLLLSDQQTRLRWIRNNGDMTFEEISELIAVDRVVDVQYADFDNDGDVDLATLNDSGTLIGWSNERNGVFSPRPIATSNPRVAIAVGDVNRDGRFELVSVSSSGALLAASCNSVAQWTETLLLASSRDKQAAPIGAADKVFVAIADLDNNGASDVLASIAAKTQVWLCTPAGDFKRIAQTINMDVKAVVDTNADGLLDLVGNSDTGANVALNRSAAGYGWQVVQPKANPNAGDKRINSFGIGGRIDMRAGNVVQAALIASPRVHFGLGRQPQADLIRIVWPNGTSQAEFDFQKNQAFVANQRLKGSCPWIFTFDGRDYQFVKDFIWRSPLGLRINAQTTAGVTQTEDWIKLAGDHLVARDGYYSVRITAELWETHFFDRVALLAVDHPDDVTVLIDERFIPNKSPEHRVIAATHPQPLSDLRDDGGHRLDDQLRANDGVYADQFALGAYQGIAQEHWVEFTLAPEVSAERPVLLVGQGWIYPTDSSVNVAIAQGDLAKPFGLVLERKDADGKWQVVDENLGFPAGKNKEIAIEIPRESLEASHTFRLRTNMEIYWDSLRWSYAVPDAAPRVTELKTEVADLRYRGFSRLQPLDRRKPDTPIYEVATTEQRWLDLEGYYTRFGDVRQLLATVDDRYVIMNAGDELHFDFQAAEAPPVGWKRDFVLIGDGWVKDGDFNTAYSQTVEPLPSHGDSEYGPMAPLEADPIYRLHEDDWKQYHTRYVTPRHFPGKLWKSAVPLTAGDAQQ